MTERTIPVARLTKPDLAKMVDDLPNGRNGYAIQWGYNDLAFAAEAEVHRRYEVRDRQVLAAFIAKLSEKEPNGEARFGDGVIQELGDLLGAVLELPVDTPPKRDPEDPVSRMLAGIKVFNDAYRAFVGAFDTPVARRRNPDEYCDDARQRLRKAALRFDSLSATLEKAPPAVEPEATRFANTVPVNVAYCVEWTEYEDTVQRFDGYTYAISSDLLEAEVTRITNLGTSASYSKASDVKRCLVDQTLLQFLALKGVINCAHEHSGVLGYFVPVKTKLATR